MRSAGGRSGANARESGEFGDGSAPGRDAGSGAGEADGPWVETRAGGLFFLNAVLVGPELVVLVPLILGATLRGLGLLDGPSRFIDPVPRVAAHVLPWLGWVLVVPVWTTLRNLRMRGVKPWARRALYGMLLLHAGFLGYTVWRWVGGGG